MTGPPDPPEDPAVTLARLGGTVAALAQQVADLRRQMDTAKRTLDRSGVTLLGPALAALNQRVEELAQLVADALDAASPKGPPAPRWDGLDPAGRARELTRLTTWADKILVPHYCAGGLWTLPRCWARHPPALWELGALAAQWRRIYDRDRPNLGLALEFYDRWLPHTMTRLGEMTRNCTPEHRP